MDLSGGACQHSLALECIPSCPLLTALLVSPWVSASRPWRARAVYATHPGLPPGPWREHQCCPSVADAPAMVQMPTRFATVILSAAQLSRVNAPAGLVASALKCGPLSNCLIAPRVGQVPARSRCCLVRWRPASEFHSRFWRGPAVSCRRSGCPGGERSQ